MANVNALSGRTNTNRRSARLIVLLLAFAGPALLLDGCTIAGGACPCPRGQICRSGRCLPERVAVPAPGGPL